MGNDKGRSFCFPAVVPALREGEPGPDVEQELSGLGGDLRGPGDGQRHSGPAAAPRHHPEHQGGKLSAQGETQGGKRGNPGLRFRKRNRKNRQPEENDDKNREGA